MICFGNQMAFPIRCSATMKLVLCTGDTDYCPHTMSGIGRLRGGGDIASEIWSLPLGEVFPCKLWSSQILIFSLGGGAFLVWNSLFNINKRTKKPTVFIYLCKLVVTCVFRFNIHDLFVYFFKVMSTTASQITICLYLLMQITCW